MVISDSEMWSHSQCISVQCPVDKDCGSIPDGTEYGMNGVIGRRDSEFEKMKEERDLWRRLYLESQRERALGQRWGCDGDGSKE